MHKLFCKKSRAGIAINGSQRSTLKGVNGSTDAITNHKFGILNNVLWQVLQVRVLHYFVLAPDRSTRSFNHCG
jgi:hypothetical protein